jgi:hypothetical protein
MVDPALTDLMTNFGFVIAGLAAFAFFALVAGSLIAQRSLTSLQEKGLQAVVGTNTIRTVDKQQEDRPARERVVVREPDDGSDGT